MPQLAGALDLVNSRGPRYAVMGSIRRGEAAAVYAETADQAEQIKERWQEQGRYQVRVYPPEGSFDLAPLTKARQDAIAAERDATAILRAAVIREHERGRSEVELARQADVDRMTVRKWLGKVRVAVHVYVMRGESPGARAVEFGAASVDIPDDLLAWAEANGLDHNDTDSYLLVAPADEPAPSVGVIASREASLPAADVATIRAALDEE